jgi:uncharacterized protein YlxP (DUF503 family)
MYVGLAKLELWLDGSTNNKYKSGILQKVKTRVKSKFNVSIAQVAEDRDYPDYIEIGISTLGGDPKAIESRLAKVIDFIESLAVGRIENEIRDVLFFEG